MLDWDINGVFNDSATQEVNWHHHMTRVDLAIDYYNTNLKVEPLANKVTDTDERNRSVVSLNAIDGLTVMMSNAFTGGSICAHE